MFRKKFVCPDCVGDYAVAEFVNHNANGNKCSYCGANASSASAEDVGEFIKEAIEREYEDPAESVMYVSEEGGYLLECSDGREVLENAGLDEAQTDFLEDVSDLLNDHEWIRRDPYADPEDEAMWYSWERFCLLLQHKNRFNLFTKQTTTHGEENPYEILKDIGNVVRRVGLIKTIQKGTRIVRARQHSSIEVIDTAQRLGPPPPEKASHSRMSPAGIPAFYGARDEQTAFCEILEDDIHKSKVTFGDFECARDIVVLDLTDIPNVPSLFDENSAGVRLALSFMQQFEGDVTKQIPRDSTAGYLYVPTQVVAEYFRDHFDKGSGNGIDGILFRSSRNTGGICVTLFLTSEDCCDSFAPGKTLILKGSRTADISNGTFLP